MTLTELTELAKGQGVIVTGSLLLLGVVAWIAGQGGKAAIKNVKSLLEMNEELRKSLATQLDRANQGRDDAERVNAQLRADLEDGKRRMSELEGRLDYAERRSNRLQSELDQALAENARLRLA